MDDPLSNPYRHALLTEQSTYAIGNAFAKRFPPDVIPFAAVVSGDSESWEVLYALLTPGESVKGSASSRAAR